MEVWFVKGTNIDGDVMVAGVYTTEAKAEAAAKYANTAQPRGSFYSDGPYEVDEQPRVTYY